MATREVLGDCRDAAILYRLMAHLDLGPLVPRELQALRPHLVAWREQAIAAAAEAGWLKGMTLCAADGSTHGRITDVTSDGTVIYDHQGRGHLSDLAGDRVHLLAPGMPAGVFVGDDATSRALYVASGLEAERFEYIDSMR